MMDRLVSVKAYDGTIVRIPESKINEFTIRQERIKKLLKEGRTIEEVLILLKEGAL